MHTPQDFLQRLGCRLPIVQAPMAGVATPALAAAVSNHGALGSLGLGAASAEQARQMIEATRALTDGPLNLNFFCHAPLAPDPDRDAQWMAHLAPLLAEAGLTPPASLKPIYRSFIENDDMLAVLLATRPTVASFHFGLPTPSQIQALKAAGILLMATATNLDEARMIEAAGFDAIIAQGIEAGGHRGCFIDPGIKPAADIRDNPITRDNPSVRDQALTTPVLVRLLRANTHLPLIAAGGIMDGQGIRAMLALGAAAAQLGTAFILCPESAADDSYRAALKSPGAGQTRLTDTISGRPARGLENRFIRQSEQPGRPPASTYPRAYDLFKQLSAAARSRQLEGIESHWAGQGAALARELPAAQLVEQLAKELSSNQ